MYIRSTYSPLLTCTWVFDRIGKGYLPPSIILYTMYIIIIMCLPRAHVQGVKQSVLSVCLSVSTKIARSGDLGIIVRCKYHYSLGNVGKFTFFCLLSTWKGPRTLKSLYLPGTPFDHTQFKPCAVQLHKRKLKEGRDRHIHKLVLVIYGGWSWPLTDQCGENPGFISSSKFSAFQCCMLKRREQYKTRALLEHIPRTHALH